MVIHCSGSARWQSRVRLVLSVSVECNTLPTYDSLGNRWWCLQRRDEVHGGRVPLGLFLMLRPVLWQKQLTERFALPFGSQVNVSANNLSRSVLETLPSFERRFRDSSWEEFDPARWAEEKMRPFLKRTVTPTGYKGLHVLIRSRKWRLRFERRESRRESLSRHSRPGQPWKKERNRLAGRRRSVWGAVRMRVWGSWATWRRRKQQCRRLRNYVWLRGLVRQIRVDHIGVHVIRVDGLFYWTWTAGMFYSWDVW